MKNSLRAQVQRLPPPLDFNSYPIHVSLFRRKLRSERLQSLSFKVKPVTSELQPFSASERFRQSAESTGFRASGVKSTASSFRKLQTNLQSHWLQSFRRWLQSVSLQSEASHFIKLQAKRQATGFRKLQAKPLLSVRALRLSLFTNQPRRSLYILPQSSACRGSFQPGTSVELPSLPSSKEWRGDGGDHRFQRFQGRLKGTLP